MAKTILQLNNREASSFLMKPEQYCTSELPEYFDFSKVLEYAKKSLGNRQLESCKTNVTPDSLSGVSLEILTNKDGKYGVRPLTLPNPFLYTFLVNVICKKHAWSQIQECFKMYSVSKIKACAIPVVPDDSKKEPFHKSTSILNWWSTMEQMPIELSLRYRYMFMSDITNCFGQINPQSIDWALSRKDTEWETDDNHGLAHSIIRLLKAMQGGRNIGIPQGSALFSFIAEIVLGYADLLLSKAIKEAGITEDYAVLRYVDDYRIFCNNRDVLEQISYLLQHVLESLNFRMNTSKTRISETILADAVKPDKAFYIFNTPIESKKGGIDFDGFQKHLYFIFEFAKRFPNSGQLKVQLSGFSTRIERYLKPRKSKKSKGKLLLDENGLHEREESTIFKPKFLEKIAPMVAIATQIAVDNVAAANHALRVVSLLLNVVDDEIIKDELIDLVYNKLRHQPNSAYLQIWLQNITHQVGKTDSFNYDMPLCRLLDGTLTDLWNNDWILPEIADNLPYDTICNAEILAKTNRVITFREARAYTESYS
jgi:hypothetical protein